MNDSLKTTAPHLLARWLRIPVLRSFFPALAIAGLLYFISFHILLPETKRLLIQSEYNLIQRRTTLLYEEIVKVYEQVQAGHYQERQAQTLLRDSLRTFRYGRDESSYVWICDKDYRLIMHPFLTGLENQPVDRAFRYPGDIALFHQALDQAVRQRSGLIRYRWFQQSDPATMMWKESYTRYFEPWGWVIGTGFILDQVHAEIGHMQSKLFWLLCLVFVMVSCFSLYIVTRKNIAIRQQRQAEQILIERERHYRQIFNAIGESVLVLDAETGRIIDVNTPFQDAFGHRKEEIDTLTLDQLSAGQAPFTQADALERIHKAAKEGPQQFEWLARRKDGRLFWTEVSLRSSQIGGRLRVIAIVRDISERKKNDADRDAIYHELKSTNVQLEQFFYAVSHDLKSPLVTINGFTTLLKQDMQNGKMNEAAEMLDTIATATAKMTDLLDGLMEFSRARHKELELEPVDLKETIRDAITLSLRANQRKSVMIQVDNELPVIHANRIGMLQVMQNLITNAVKYMGGQINPEIHIGTAEKEGRRAFYVRDNGIGIAPEHQQIIFRPFEQLDPTREGAGMGLSLVKRILEQQDGRIWVESAGINQGSTFWFTLPEKTGQP